MPPFTVTEEPFEDIPVLSVIEPPHELIEVAGEMLSTHMMECARNSALEQRPEVLNGVGEDFILILL